MDDEWSGIETSDDSEDEQSSRNDNDSSRSLQGDLDLRSDRSFDVLNGQNEGELEGTDVSAWEPLRLQYPYSNTISGLLARVQDRQARKATPTTR